jgi:hypothetical protein
MAVVFTAEDTREGEAAGKPSLEPEMIVQGDACADQHSDSGIQQAIVNAAPNVISFHALEAIFDARNSARLAVSDKHVHLGLQLTKAVEHFAFKFTDGHSHEYRAMRLVCVHVQAVLYLIGNVHNGKSTCSAVE